MSKKQLIHASCGHYAYVYSLIVLLHVSYRTFFFFGLSFFVVVAVVVFHTLTDYWYLSLLQRTGFTVF